MVGFRAWETVRHNDVTMNKMDGIIEKNSCSNCMLKSKSPSFIWSKLPSPVENGIVGMVGSASYFVAFDQNDGFSVMTTRAQG